MGRRQVGSRRQRAGSGLRSRAEPQPGAHTAAEQRTPNQTVGPVLGESESEEKERRRQRDGEGERDRETEAGGDREGARALPTGRTKLRSHPPQSLVQLRGTGRRCEGPRL